jgi:membrane protein implicated in regulation of membrane protease activity
MPWPLNYRVRTYRIAALVIVVAGIPTAISEWIYHGHAWAIAIATVHLYAALVVALFLPWLQRRARDRQPELGERDDPV